MNFLTKYEDKNEEFGSKDANYERPARREQFLAELVHEFTNMVTAVIGYGELAIHAIEDSHPARGWLEKIRGHTRQLAFLVQKLSALNQKSETSGQK